MRRLWLAAGIMAIGAACQEAPAGRPVRPAAAPAPAAAAEGLDVRQPGRTAAPAPTAERNPFRFGDGSGGDGGSGGDIAGPPLPPPDGLPELPLPLAQSPLRLLGIATEAGGVRTAMIRIGADLVLAREGETLVNRYRVVQVAEDAVTLTDAVGDLPVRLALP